MFMDNRVCDIFILTLILPMDSLHHLFLSTPHSLLLALLACTSHSPLPLAPPTCPSYSTLPLVPPLVDRQKHPPTCSWFTCEAFRMLVCNNRAGSICPLDDSAADLTSTVHASPSQSTVAVLVQTSTRLGDSQAVFSINFTFRTRTSGHFILDI